MRGFKPFITALVFTYGFYLTASSPTVSSSSNATADLLNFIEIINNATTDADIPKPAGNIMEFISMIKTSVAFIRDELELHSTQVSEFFKNDSRAEYRQGSSPNDFNFVLSTVRESISEVSSLVDNLIRRVQMIGTEKNVRQYVRQMMPPRENEVSLDQWINDEANEIREETANIGVHYSEMINSYKVYLSNLKVLRRRLEIPASYKKL